MLDGGEVLRRLSDLRLAICSLFFPPKIGVIGFHLFTHGATCGYERYFLAYRSVRAHNHTLYYFCGMDKPLILFNLGRTLDVTTPMYNDLVCYRHLCRGASIGVSIVRLGGLRTPCHVPRGMCLAAPFVGLFLSWRS